MYGRCIGEIVVGVDWWKGKWKFGYVLYVL